MENEPGSAGGRRGSFEFIDSSHGGKILIRSGYRHRINRTNRCGTSVYTCATKFCNGNIVLNPTKTEIVRESLHTCTPDFESIEVEKSIVKLKTKVITDYRPVPQLFQKAMSKFRTPEYADKVPSFFSKRDGLYRNKKRNSVFCIFENVSDVIIPEHLARDFLCLQTDECLIFISPPCKNYIKNVETFFADGTFKIVPHPYAQLYTLCGDIGTDKDFTKVVPFVYALLTNKQQVTYEILFNKIKEILPDFNPKVIKADFELAPINALRTIFPQVKIRLLFSFR